MEAPASIHELRLALAPDIAASAIFDGWTETALVAAAEMAGADVDVAKLAFPGARPMDMIEAWIASVDQAMEAEWPAERLAALKIRERIRTLVAFRLESEERALIGEAVSVITKGVGKAGSASKVGGIGGVSVKKGRSYGEGDNGGEGGSASERQLYAGEVEAKLRSAWNEILAAEGATIASAGSCGVTVAIDASGFASFSGWVRMLSQPHKRFMHCGETLAFHELAP